MEDEKIKQTQGELNSALTGAKKVLIKKVYTPPTLTLYGKLTELTAGGTNNAAENQGVPAPCNQNKPFERC